MESRSSPGDPGEKERPRWIEGPTATNSQPEAQPQMAHIHDTGDCLGTQSSADVELDNFLCKPSRGKTPPTVAHAPTVPGIVHHDSGWTPGVEFELERLIVVGREHDDGRLSQWTYDMLSGRWTQPKQVNDDTSFGIRETPLPRSPRGPPGAGFAAISLHMRKFLVIPDLAEV